MVQRYKLNTKATKRIQFPVDKFVNNLYMMKLDKGPYSIILKPKLNKIAT